MAVRGTVPGCFPQTVPFAEACTTMVYQGLTEQGKAVGFSDCLNALESPQQPLLRRLRPGSVTAGLALEALALRSLDPQELHKVKAHQNLAALSGNTLWEAQANACVDLEAKAARAIHAGGDHAAWAQVDREYTLAVELAISASKAARAWPPRPRCPTKNPSK